MTLASFIGSLIMGLLGAVAIVLIVYVVFQFAILWILLGGVYLLLGSIFHWF